MKKIYTYNVKPGYRNLTVADIKANKGVKKLTQVNAKNAEEAYAAGIANIDMLIYAVQTCNAGYDCGT